MLGDRRRCTMKVRTSPAAAVFALGSVATPALAADICVQESLGGHWRFQRVSRLRPLRTIALRGVYAGNGGGAPIDGTASMRSDNTVAIGAFVHSMDAGQNNFTVTLTGNAQFTASGVYDSNGDFQSNGPISFAPTYDRRAPSERKERQS
jgi:hypothetical protein